MQVIYPEKRDRESGAKPRTAWTPPSSDLKSRHRFEYHDRVDQDAVEVEGCSDTLCRGEVAEWLNAAVSKTVTSVIPASGVRIPPSPRGTPLRGVPHAQANAYTCQQRFALKGSLSANRA